MKKEMMAGIVLIVCILLLIVLVQRQEAKRVRAEVERDMVYCIASKNYCKSGIFNLYYDKSGVTIIELIKKTSFAGAGDNAKQGGKKSE